MLNTKRARITHNFFKAQINSAIKFVDMNDNEYVNIKFIKF